MLRVRSFFFRRGIDLYSRVDSSSLLNPYYLLIASREDSLTELTDASSRLLIVW